MKAKKILRNLLMGLLIYVLAVLGVLQIGVTVKYWDYFRNSEGAFLIPGLFDAYVPQGFDYMEETDTYLMCGYMSNGSPSRIYIRFSDGTTRFASLYFADGSIDILTGEVPLYYLDSDNLTETVVMPPMSEGLVYRDGRVQVMYESACNKYIYGKLIRGWRVRDYIVE